jgi:hypothetical protein
MKQFLLDKLNSLSQEVLLEFNNSITNNLPSNLGLKRIWGFEDSGFWFLDEHSAWFFEDYGIHHSIDIYRNKEFSLAMKLLDTEEKNFIPTHLEFEELKLENSSHPNISNGAPLYYNKFVNPRNTYGNTLLLDSILGTSVGKDADITEKFFNFYEKTELFEKKYSDHINQLQEYIHNNLDYLNYEYQNGFTVLRDQEGYFFSKVGWATGTERLYNKYLNDSSLKERMKYIWTKSAT